MSTSRGNTSRQRPQKYQNKTAFKNDLHDTSHKTKFLNSLEVTGVCKRCKEIIEWKIKYKKYKPLTTPAKCVNCSQKSIKYAYHVLCTSCVTEKKKCAKCCKPLEDNEITVDVKSQELIAYEKILINLPERKRRTILRCIKKNETPENIDMILSKMDKVSLEDEALNFSSDELSDDSADL